MNNHKRKQIIQGTLQEIRKELNHHDSEGNGEKASKKKVKSKRKVRPSKNEKLEEHKNAIKSNGDKRKQIIKNILQQKREELSQNKLKQTKRVIKKRKVKSKRQIGKRKELAVHENEIESENDLPLAVRLLNQGRTTYQVQLPEMSSHNWNKFKKELAEKDVNEINQKVKKCLDKMRGYCMFDIHFNALHFIRKAIVDSLLSRKWDNLVRLLAMLIKNYSDPVFTMFIRHMCEILKHYHPRIRGTDLEDQIELIMEKHEKIRNSRLHMTNVV